MSNDQAVRAEQAMDLVLGHIRLFLGHLHTLAYQSREPWVAEYLDIQREMERIRIRLLKTNTERLETLRGR